MTAIEPLPELRSEWSILLERYLRAPMRRIFGWRTPLHWSDRDWREELRAVCAAAAWQAVCEYDASRGILRAAFIARRVFTRALTRYRQEWRYAIRCVPEADVEAFASSEHEPSSVLHESLHSALATLPQSDRWLIDQLFWKGRKETEVASALGISQPGVSKRRRAALRKLARCLDAQ